MLSGIKKNILGAKVNLVNLSDCVVRPLCLPSYQCDIRPDYPRLHKTVVDQL